MNLTNIEELSTERATGEGELHAVASDEHDNGDQVRPDLHDHIAEEAIQADRLARATQHDAEVRELNAKKAEKKFDGVIDPKSGLYRINAEPFERDELTRWRLLKRGNPNIIQDIIDAYRRGEWSDSRKLQGWLSGKKFYSKSNEKLYQPGSGYFLRAAIARTLPDPDNHGNVDTHAVREGYPPLLERVDPTGLGGVRKVRCLRCDEKFRPICPDCRKKSAAKRKAATERKKAASTQSPIPAQETA